MCVTDEAESHSIGIYMWLPCPESGGSEWFKVAATREPVMFRCDEVTKWFVFLFDPRTLNRVVAYKVLGLMKALLCFHNLFEPASLRDFW